MFAFTDDAWVLGLSSEFMMAGMRIQIYTSGFVYFCRPRNVVVVRFGHVEPLSRVADDDTPPLRYNGMERRSVKGE